MKTEFHRSIPVQRMWISFKSLDPTVFRYPEDTRLGTARDVQYSEIYKHHLINTGFGKKLFFRKIKTQTNI